MNGGPHSVLGVSDQPSDPRRTHESHAHHRRRRSGRRQRRARLVRERRAGGHPGDRGRTPPRSRRPSTQFRNSLGNDNAGNPAAANGRRQINWDAVPDGRSAPSFMPENNFRNRGALFSTPGTGFEVSGDDDDDAGAPDADPDLIEFTDVNPTYSTALRAVLAERLFAPIGSNVTRTNFVVPNTDTAADTNGIGVVFSDVDHAGADDDRTAGARRQQPRHATRPGDRGQRQPLVPRCPLRRRRADRAASDHDRRRGARQR